MINAMGKSKTSGRATDEVLLHGCLLATNMLISEDAEQIYIVDWSNAHAGSLGEDLTELICWNLSPNLRHDSLDELLEHYRYHFLKYCPERRPQDKKLKTYEKYL
ncbi:unnamed protein product [Gongylonema pulchrum]|uniref:APH domain-containing protein n=1 Tax=Gongylonema pulchrum TaxID=637853 RepID=A0A183ERV9_9BILA|nr:unnamed protein product [Gongylonema pulchrum]